LKPFDSCQVHNMLTSILEPFFKSLWVGVECGNAIYFTIEYDVKKNNPLFNANFWTNLNLSIQVEIIISIDEQTFEGEKEKENMFIIGASMKESS